MEIKVGLLANATEAIARVWLSEMNISKQEWDRMSEKEKNEALSKRLIIVERSVWESNRADLDQLTADLDRGRYYLMSVAANKITVEDALESFGFGRSGCALRI